MTKSQQTSNYGGSLVDGSGAGWALASHQRNNSFRQFSPTRHQLRPSAEFSLSFCIFRWFEQKKKKRNIQITFFVTKVKIGSLYSRSGEEVDMGRQENGHFRYPHSVAEPSESKMAWQSAWLESKSVSNKNWINFFPYFPDKHLSFLFAVHGIFKPLGNNGSTPELICYFS